jgi:hypothetical protein
VVIKPTPSKLVLLMSAAGLGLTCSGVALASRDSSASASFALTFGMTQRSEQGCSPESKDALALCAPAGEELLRTIVAESAALPLPLPHMPRSSDAQVSFRAVNDHAEASTLPPSDGRSGDGEPAPRNEAPRAQALVNARDIDVPERDPVADAIALMVLENPQEVLGDSGATVSALTANPVPPAQRVGPPVSEVEVHRPVGQAEDGVSATIAARSKTISTAKSEPSGEIADDQTQLPTVSAERGAIDSAPAGTSAEPVKADSAALDRVLASLADVLGAQMEEAATDIDQTVEQAAASKDGIAPLAPALDHPAAEPPVVTAVAQNHLPSDSGSSLERSIEAEDIVVVSSHSDKVLMSLAALRSSEESQTVRLGAQTKKSVVLRHSDKVLETLALFQSKKSESGALACTLAPEESDQFVMPAKSFSRWAAPEPISESMFANIEAELDILLDLQPPTANGEAHAASTLSAPPVAVHSGRSVIGANLVALSTEKLDEVRGGFETGGGLKISFGIERAVYLNGSLVTTTSLNIADLSKISGGQAQLTGSGKDALALLQSGTGNIFAPGSISSTAAGTVIQNTLDNQKINTITRIDAVVNSAGIMRSMNLQSSMQSAIVNSLRR